MNYYTLLSKKSSNLIPHKDKFATTPVLHPHNTGTQKSKRINSLLSFITTPAEGQHRRQPSRAHTPWHWPQDIHLIQQQHEYPTFNTHKMYRHLTAEQQSHKTNIQDKGKPLKPEPCTSNVKEWEGEHNQQNLKTVNIWSATM